MQSLKHKYPFRLGTTSFIYRADYTTNVIKLGPYVDEIELLLFESAPSSRPSEEQIHQLHVLAAQEDLHYNVHLPSDIDLGSPNPIERRRAVDVLTDVMDLVLPLSATTHTLHLTYGQEDRSQSAVSTWQERTLRSVTQFLTQTSVDPGLISVETLDYPYLWWAPIVKTLGLSVCLDVGHIIRYGFDLNGPLNDFADRITILHLHGIVDGADHCDLSGLPTDARCILKPFLLKFDGTVSLEIFSLQALEISLDVFDTMMSGAPC